MSPEQANEGRKEILVNQIIIQQETKKIFEKYGFTDQKAFDELEEALEQSTQRLAETLSDVRSAEIVNNYKEKTGISVEGKDGNIKYAAAEILIRLKGEAFDSAVGDIVAVNESH